MIRLRVTLCGDDLGLAMRSHVPVRVSSRAPCLSVSIRIGVDMPDSESKTTLTIEDYHQKLGYALGRERSLLVFLQRFHMADPTRTAQIARLQDEAAAILTSSIDRSAERHMADPNTTGLDWALLDRIKNRARELCRLADGSPCSGPDTDCDPSNCHAMERADMECRKP